MDKKNIEDILALTPMQEGMLYHYLKDPENDYYFEQLGLSISGEIDIPMFRNAWDEVVKNNETLRTVFRWEEVKKPTQIVLKHHQPRVEIFDYPGKPGEHQQWKRWVEEIKIKDRKRKFHLTEVPFRVTLCKINGCCCEMILSYHHILYDGWSSGIILKEFIETYNRWCEGGDGKGKQSAKTKFKEYVRWIQNRDLKGQEHFWKNYLQGIDTRTILPASKTKVRHAHDQGIIDAADYLAVIPGDIRETWEVFVKTHRITLAALFYTTWAILLQRYNNSKDVIFGTTISGRSAKIKGIEDVVGLLINTLPLRVQTYPGDTVGGLLKRVHDTLQLREDYETTSLADIKVYSQRDNQDEIFDSIVVVDNYPLDHILLQKSKRITVQSYSMFEMSNYDLTLGIALLLKEIKVKFSYNTELFEEENIARLFDHFMNLLLDTTVNPGKPVSQLQMLTGEEKKQLLFDLNDTGEPYPLDKTIHERFEQQVDDTPSTIAVVFENERFLTYGHMNRLANQLAHRLRTLGVKAETTVAIMGEYSLEMGTGLMAVLKAGGVYATISPNYPEKRVEYILKDSQAKILLTQVDFKNRFPGVAFTGSTIEISEPMQSADPGTGKNPGNITAPAHLAFILYTSGSTGKPKGVMVEHRNVNNLLSWFGKTYGLKVGVRVLQLTDYTFDPHVDDIFGTLFFGSTLYVVGRDLLIDMEALRRHIERHQLNLINCVPSLIKELLCRGHRLPSMHTVISGGDRLDDALKDELIDRGYLLFNHYGLIETTVDILVSRCAKTVGASVVRPLANTGAYIVDQDKNLLPGGVIGELSLSGDSLGRGYLNRPGLTQDRFPASPFKPGERMFLTGDLAKLTPGGEIEIMDRMDHQVKIRGFRIELGEIENQLSKHKDIKEAAVTARENNSGSKYLCGYVVPAHNPLEVDGQRYHIYTTAQQPGFKDKIEQVHTDAWPTFFIGDQINVKYWKQLYEVFPDFQVGIVDESGNMIAAGNSIPIAWNGKIPDLPEGWDDAVVKGFETARDCTRGTVSNTLCVLAGVVNQAFKSKGMSYEVIKIMKRIAREKGFEYMIIPVRVTEKEQFPYMPLEEYCEKKRDDGLPFDPWLRVHLRLGGKIIGYSHVSQRVKGTIREWETWTGQSFEKSGAYVIPGAMQPVNIDIENHRGTYNDLAVWMQHTPAQENQPPINLINSANIRDYLSRVLPDYMVPVKYVFLEKIPLTPIGKIDRKALPAPEMKIEKTYAPPKNKIEEKLLEIWAAVLELDQEKISTNDNFFHLGGHSLQATEVVYRTRQALEIKLELREFMKDPVIALLAEKVTGLRPIKYLKIPRAEKREYYDLSHAQQRLWVICQFEEDSTTYNMAGTFTITGKLDPVIFEKAIQTLAQRHDSPRTIFIHVNGEPKQKIIPPHLFKFHLQQIDLQEIADPVLKEKKTGEIIKNTANSPFNLGRAPLFIFKLLRLEKEKFLLVVNIHHLINDGWSLGIINNEIFTLYNTYKQNKQTSLVPLQLQYKDYALWHNALIRGGQLDKYGKYWINKFKDKPTGIELPLDRPRGSVQTFNGGRLYFTIDKKKRSEIYRLCPEVEATFFMKILAILNILFYKYTGQTDMIIASPFAGRNTPELHNMIGFLVNTLVYRNKVDPRQSFRELLRVIRKETLESYENQDYPFDHLVGELGLDRDLSRSPLFNVIIGYDNVEIDDRTLKMEGITFSYNRRIDEFTPSPFDLSFYMDELDQQVNGEILYNSDLFERQTIQRLIKNLKNLVDHILTDQDQPIHSLNFLDSAEYGKVTEEFNQTEVPFPHRILSEMLEAHVPTCADCAAVVRENKTVTYGYLHGRANQLAHYLRDEWGVKPGDIVGVSLDRSIEMIAAIMGVVKSGAGYLAIDPTYPPDRALHMLTDSRAPLVITDNAGSRLLEQYEGTIIHLGMKETWQEIEGKSLENPAAVNTPEDILYVIYTSGSTGVPNGAMLSHGILTNLVHWQNTCTSIDSSGRCLQFTSTGFCVSFQEIMITLCSGGEVHLIGEIERQDIDYLMNFLSRHRIEILYLPFSYLNFLFNESDRWGEHFKHSLQHIITAGEQLKITAGLRQFLERHPRIKLHNHYGSSEMHVVTSYSLDAANAAQNPIPPAGKPVANTKIYILDEHDNPVPIGVWGELCVSGSAEVAGYINNKTLTDKKLFNPLFLPGSSRRLYRSGDIGRWLPDGNIELKGRKDFQVKVRGFRVELSEIESKLLAVKGVRDCVAVVREAAAGEKMLLAYVVLDGIDVPGIKKIIKNYLPLYMIPKFVVLESLPLMSNGKVDRDNLPEPEEEQGLIHGIEFEKVSSYLTGLLENNLFKQPLTVTGIHSGVLSAGKRKELLFDLVGTGTGKSSKTTWQSFADQARQTPDSTAVLGKSIHETGEPGIVKLTYRELSKQAHGLACLLQKKGIKPGAIVAIMLEPWVEAAACILGILKTGAAYMVLEPGLPTRRITARLEESGAALLLTDTPRVREHYFTFLQGLHTSAAPIHRSATRSPVDDFDSIPFPDRSLVNMEEYSKYIGISIVKNCISLQATRGCPYKCAYCHKIWPKQHVYRSAENIYQEVELYNKMGVRRFVIIDDVFNLNIKNSTRFFQLILKNKLDVEFYFASGLRGDILTRDYIDLMVEAGTVDIGLSLETASPRLQKLIGKNLKLDRFKENADYLCQQYPHVILDLNTMHGFPTETEEEALMTLDFVKNLEWVDFPYIHVLKILPNTDMEKLAIANGISQEAINISANLAFHELPDTLPFDKSFTFDYQADFLNNYFLSKERLLHVLPYQMQLLTEDDLVQKYNSYLPVDITSLDDIFMFAGIERSHLRVQSCVEDNAAQVPDFNKKLSDFFPRNKPAGDALKVLLLDLSQFFSDATETIYNVAEPPLGLIYLLTYLNEKLAGKINGKIAKSRFDFDNYHELKTMLEEFQPDIIGIRTLSYYKDFFHEAIAMIRGWGIDIPIITGGPYASSDYNTILQDTNLDLLVMGEGEITFIELVESIIANKGKLPGPGVLKGIPGLMFRAHQPGSLKNTAREILLLDSLTGVLPDIADEKHPGEANPNHPGETAYIYCTEGPGDKEEQVAVDHNGIHRLAANPGDNRLLASYCFDLSPEQVFTPLLQGSPLYILPGSAKTTETEHMRLFEVYEDTPGKTPGPPDNHMPVHIRMTVSAKTGVKEGHVRPTNSYQQKLAGIWARVLEMDQGNIGIDDNFFELGGHSLKATTLISMVHKTFNVKIKMMDVFKTPTVRELAGFIQGASEETYAAVQAVEEKEFYPLSYAQRRLWIVCQFEDESTVYNMPGAYVITGDLDVKAFKQSLQTLVNRHAGLRTVFFTVNGDPRQRIINRDNFKLNIETIDFRDYEKKEKETKVLSMYIAFANKGFDLEQGPMVRFRLVRLEERTHLFMANIHHIVNDGWSVGVINTELISMYNAFSTQRENPLPPLRAQYKDYSLWHNQLVQRGAFDKAGKYWLDKFKDKPNGIELPLDYTRKSRQTFNGRSLPFRIDEEKTQQLLRLSAQQDTTPFITLLTIFSLFLYRYTGQEDIIIGSPVAGRRKPELKDMIGFLVNTLVYRNKIKPSASFKEMLEKVKTESLDCFEYQDYPFDLLVEQLELDRDLSRSPLFNVMLGYNNLGTLGLDLELPGLSIEEYSHIDEFDMSVFDLILFLDEAGTHIDGGIMYNTDLFKAGTIERMAHNFVTFVRCIIEDPDRPVSHLNLIAPAEYEKLVHQFNETEVEFPRQTIQEMFEHQVEKTPDRIAIVGPGHSVGEHPGPVPLLQAISYRQLNEKANRFAHYLQEQFQVQPGDIMGICIDRSIEMIAAILGIVKAGAGYAAIDPNYPEDRVLHMLIDSRTELVIIDQMRPRLFDNYSGRLVNIVTEWEQIELKSAQDPKISSAPGDIVYVIYTSGSTGMPNGAMLSQALLTNLVQWQKEKTCIDGSLRCLQFTSINFCVSFQEIFTTLTAGGQVHLIGDIERQDIDYLMDFLETRRIQVLYLPFSYLNFLFNESNRWDRFHGHCLQHIITAGEQLKISSGMKRFLDANPRLKLHNHYGSSEMHVVTSYTLDASTADQTPIPPAGQPIANTGIYILDDHHNVAPIGVWGELHIDGAAEIPGYINNRSLTNEKLLAHPTLSGPNKRLYRSGDLGRWLEDGCIELSGRKDSQVKIRGFRVEIGEVESKILAIHKVRQCAVEVKEAEKEKYLVAYVVVEGIDAAEIKQKLRNDLPQYMIPKFVILDSLPLMPNGKVDRERLPEVAVKAAGITGVDAEKISALLQSGEAKELTPKEIEAVSLSDQAKVEKMLAYFTYLVQETCLHGIDNKKPNIKVSGIDINIVPADEKYQQRHDLTDSDLQAMEDRPVHQWFEEQAQRTPDAVAVVDMVQSTGPGGKQLTYRQLNKKSNQLARLLTRKGVERGVTVGIMTGTAQETVIGILAILKAGGTYLEIDPGLSDDKINTMLRQTRVSLLLTDTAVLEEHTFTQLRGFGFSYRPEIKTIKPYVTAPRSAIADFNSLPIPDRSLVDYEKYGNKIGLAMARHTITLQATRGCPYQCLYCHNIWPKRHVIRSAENIFAEVQLYYNMGMRRFVLVDDIFNLDMENSARFFRMIIQNKLKVQLFFPNGLRSDLLTKEYIDLMVKAGTVSLGLALETASPRLQKLIKKNMNLEKLRENVSYICKQYPQVILELFLMHGFPTETEEEALMTLDFLKSFKWVDFPYFHILKIYPNSKMADLAIANGVSPGAIARSATLAFHQLPETLPFDQSFTLRCQAAFLDQYFLLKERLLAKLPYQMQVLSEDEIVSKYNSYLPVDITSFDGFLEFVGIKREQLSRQEFLAESSVYPADSSLSLHEIITNHFSANANTNSAAKDTDALRVLLLDLSQFFSSHKQMLYDGVEPPLGLMYLLTYLDRELGSKVNGRIAKSGVDFDNYSELKTLLEEFKPELIGIRTLTYYSDFFHQTVAVIRSWGIDIPVIAGGPYATSDYTSLLQDRHVDLVVLSEGELTFTELIQAVITNGKRLPKEEILKDIPGLVFVPGSQTPALKAHREILVPDLLAEQLAAEPKANPGYASDPADPASIVYQLGTGANQVPEPVAVTHRQICQICSRHSLSHHRSQNSQMVASCLTDAAPHRLFPALVQGSSLLIPSKGFKPEGLDLLEFYREPAPGPVTSIAIHLVMESTAVAVAESYVGGRDHIDEKLIEVWANLLEIEKSTISIDDNFFELGGHSLKATLMMSRIHKALNVKISLTDIFRLPTLRETADYIKAAKQETFAAIEPVERKSYYPVSAAQKRLYIVQQLEPDSTAYNIGSTVILAGELNRGKIEHTCRQLIRRHESLRTSFKMIDGDPVQEVHGEVEFQMEYYDAQVAGAGDGCGEEGKPAAALIKSFIRPFDLSQAPLLRVGLIKTREAEHIFMMDMNHIITDGLSQEIFVKEFMAIYLGEKLPGIKVQYKDFTRWQNNLVQSEAFKRQEAYWLGQFKGEPPLLDLPLDYERPREKTFAGKVINFEIGEKETKLLNRLALEQGATLFMVLNALVNILLAKISGTEDIVVGTPVAGRRHADLQPIIGMFVNTLALRSFPKGEKTFAEFLEQVKNMTIQAFNNQDYPFEELVEKIGIPRQANRNPLFDVMFALQNRSILSGGVPQLDTSAAGLTVKPYELESVTAKFDLVFYAFETGTNISFVTEYSTDLYKEETIRQINKYFLAVLENITADPHKKISQIEIISKEEKTRFITQLREKRGMNKDKAGKEEVENITPARTKTKIAEFDL